MTSEELQEKCMTLQQECNDKQMALRKQYAIEHNPVKVGDIVEINSKSGLEGSKKS